MKIYNRVVIDIDSGRIEDEDYYEYDGPVAQCYGMGTAGDSSGGYLGDSAAGPGYPDYSWNGWADPRTSLAPPPTVGAPAYATAAPTLNYPTPNEMYNTIAGLPANQAQWALLQQMQAQGLPYGNEIYNMIQSNVAAGLPYAGNAETALANMKGTGTNLTNFITGLQNGLGSLGGGGGLEFYGGPLKEYLDSIKAKGLEYAPQQEAILNAMSDMGAFRGAVLPEVQAVMRALGRTGYASGSAADRGITDTMGSLYNKWQWNALTGWQTLGQQMQNFQNNLTTGYSNYGTIGNQYGANQVGMANVGAKLRGDQLQAITSAYNILSPLQGNIATGWQNLGTAAGNYNQGNINNLGQLGTATANWNTNLFNNYGNYGTGISNQMPNWYAPYDKMLGYTTA
jgi:hypothetical protein